MAEAAQAVALAGLAWACWGLANIAFAQSTPPAERTLPAAAATTTANAARAFDLAELMKLLAQRKSGRASFTEERTVSGIDGPLFASGSLSFDAPDRFARHTEKPRAESMEVVGNELSLQRGGRTRRMALDTVPELAALVQAFRGTLAGNAQLLREHFNTEVGGHNSRWTLRLTPRAGSAAQGVRHVLIMGSADDVRAVELVLASGDRALMQIQPLP